MNFTNILKLLRTYNDITQGEIAKVLNISRGLYSQYEIGDKIIPIYHINTLSNYYHVSIDYILGLTNNKHYDEKKDINNIEIGKRLKIFRSENKITQEKLAQILNTSHSTLSAYENGKTMLLTSFLYTICKKYKVSADWLLGKIDDPKYLKS